MKNLKYLNKETKNTAIVRMSTENSCAFTRPSAVLVVDELLVTKHGYTDGTNTYFLSLRRDGTIVFKKCGTLVIAEHFAGYGFDILNTGSLMKKRYNAVPGESKRRLIISDTPAVLSCNWSGMQYD